MFITQRHKQRKLAELAKKAAEPKAPQKKQSHKPAPKNIAPVTASNTSRASGEGEVILAALNQDLSALSDIKDVAKKIELKKSVLIPKWQPIVDQYIAAGSRHPFLPLVYLCIWLIDAERVADAIKYADIAIEQQQQMPEQFKCDLPKFMAQQLHDWAQRQLKASASAEPYLSQLVERIESKRWLVDQIIVTGAVYKLVAQFAESQKDFEKAENFYVKCVKENPEKHGVKTALARVQAQLGKG